MYIVTLYWRRHTFSRCRELTVGWWCGWRVWCCVVCVTSLYQGNRTYTDGGYMWIVWNVLTFTCHTVPSAVHSRSLVLSCAESRERQRRWLYGRSITKRSERTNFSFLLTVITGGATNRMCRGHRNSIPTPQRTLQFAIRIVHERRRAVVHSTSAIGFTLPHPTACS